MSESNLVTSNIPTAIGLSRPDAQAALSDQSASGSALSQQVMSLRIPSSGGAGGSSRLAWSVCVILAAATVWLSLRIYVQPAGALVDAVDSEQSASGQAAESLPVDATPASGKYAYESNGYVIVAHQILVSPLVNGRVVRLDADEGRRVNKGDVLGEIESTEYVAERDRARASLELARERLLELENGNRPEEVDQAKAELAEVEAQTEQLQAEWNRGYELRKASLISAENFEITDSKFRATQRRSDRLRLALKLMQDGPRVERINVARAEVKQAEADLAKAEWRLGNCTIVAPISGTILKRNAEEGNLVNPVAMNGSFSLCDIADLSDLEVSLDVPERDISKVFVGQPCKVRPDAFKARVYDGVVSRLMPIANRAKSSITVRVKLRVPAEEEGVYLKPDMSALVSFLNPEEKTADARGP
ncbi:MAG: HlyD family efflux transporter periplasmic adaptor subunit [Planctomycetes bacterium]|nr:HlyD family efflux transporter periplasmic adaptor subunit [Planctomycetota bacterium]